MGQNITAAGGSSMSGTGGSLPSPEAGAGTDGGTGPIPAGDSGASDCTPARCELDEPLRECGDCIDNDVDGRKDSADPECLGPCDDSETEFVTGFPSGVMPSCRADCFFDRNRAPNERCVWSFDCDPLSIAPDYFPTGRAMCDYNRRPPTCGLQGDDIDRCTTGCLPFTPNGCDCFGCCELPAGSSHFVWLGSETLVNGTCDPTVAGEGSCPPCTPVVDCQNPCEDCELCVGRTSLPETCMSGPETLPSCPGGLAGCDPSRGINCDPLHYCITGCCVPLPQ